MLAFIRKRFPSRERIHEHSDEQLKKPKSNEKKKKRSSSTIGELVVGPSTSPCINQPYSDVDYFPMHSGGLAGKMNDEKLSSNHDSTSDCYFNPSDTFDTKNDAPKSRIINIPITFIQNDSGETNSKRS